MRKIVRAVLEISNFETIFGLIWRRFPKYLQIEIFFGKSGRVTFLTLWSPNFMQKIRKILRAVSEKTGYQLRTDGRTDGLTGVIPKDPVGNFLGPKSEKSLEPFPRKTDY